ncbi:MAG TPA: ankyrin repeat domain-containing protein [Bacilli bacterium]|nr:ankyrin repeat domain-containing protein [Bacilli bacterium]
MINLHKKWRARGAKGLLAATLLMPLVGMPTVTNAAASSTDLTLYLDGQLQKLDQKPYLVNGHTMVPVRFLSEAMGLEVEWNQQYQEVTIKGRDQRWELQIGEAVAYSGFSYPTEMPVAAEIQDGHTMVPLRFLIEMLGADIKWNAASRAVEIRTLPWQIEDAIKASDERKARELLTQTGDLQEKTYGWNLLETAIYHDEWALADDLLAAGASIQPHVGDWMSYAYLPVAAGYGDPVTTRYYLRHQEEVNDDQLMQAAFAMAVMRNETGTVQAMIDGGFRPSDEIDPQSPYDENMWDWVERFEDFNRPEKNGLLQFPVRANNTVLLEQLLKAGLDPDYVMKKLPDPQEADDLSGGLFNSFEPGNAHDVETPLMMAAYLNRADAARLLLAYGADPNRRDADGWTALMIAAEHGNPQVAQVLLEAGADPKLTNADGLNAMTMADALGNVKTTNKIRAYGARVQSDKLAQTFLDDHLVPYMATMSNEERKNMEPEDLYAAYALSSQTGQVRALQEAYPELTAKKMPGVGFLLLQETAFGYSEMSQAILDTVADEDLQKLDSLVEFTEQVGDVQLVQRLLAAGATAILMPEVVERQDLSMLRAVFEAADDPQTLADSPLSDYTVLQEAVYNGNAEEVKLLLDYGADPNLSQDNIAPPLHAAAGSDGTEIVRLLLDAGADIDYAFPDGLPFADEEYGDYQGYTALLFAVEGGNTATVKLLLERGANPELAGVDGLTPLMLAKKKEHSDIEQLLLDTGATK